MSTEGSTAPGVAGVRTWPGVWWVWAVSHCPLCWEVETVKDSDVCVGVIHVLVLTYVILVQ